MDEDNVDANSLDAGPTESMQPWCNCKKVHDYRQHSLRAEAQLRD
jgi:hypothetical protein